MERQWKLGEDLFTSDNLLDPITFDELIMTVHCNCREITPEAVWKELSVIMEFRKQDLHELMVRNMDEIIKAAKVGRE